MVQTSPQTCILYMAEFLSDEQLRNRGLGAIADIRNQGAAAEINEKALFTRARGGTTGEEVALASQRNSRQSHSIKFMPLSSLLDTQQEHPSCVVIQMAVLHLCAAYVPGPTLRLLGAVTGRAWPGLSLSKEAREYLNTNFVQPSGKPMKKYRMPDAHVN